MRDLFIKLRIVRTVRRLHRTVEWPAIAAVAALVVFGCSSGMLPMTILDERITKRWPGTTSEELVRGRSLYRNQCSGCHSLYAPGKFSSTQWDTLLPVMQGRARTATGDRMAMTKYVLIHADTTTPAP
jgi:hypothetical protein